MDWTPQDPYDDGRSSDYPGRDQGTWPGVVGAWSVYHVWNCTTGNRWWFWDGECRATGPFLTEVDAIASRDALRLEVSPE